MITVLLSSEFPKKLHLPVAQVMNSIHQAPAVQTLDSAIHQAPVVQKLDSAIHRINHSPADTYYGKQLRYHLDSDLSAG